MSKHCICIETQQLPLSVQPTSISNGILSAPYPTVHMPNNRILAIQHKNVTQCMLHICVGTMYIYKVSITSFLPQFLEYYKLSPPKIIDREDIAEIACMRYFPHATRRLILRVVMLFLVFHK